MTRILTKLLGGIAILVFLATAVVWSVLALPIFNDWRRGVVSDILTEQIGQPLLVLGEVRAVMAWPLRVHASQVEIPSEPIPEETLAQFDSLDFDVDLVAALRGAVDIDNLRLDGLRVNLLRLEDDRTTWTVRDDVLGQTATEPERITITEAGEGILAVLGDRTTAFTNINLVSTNEKSGFEFSFELEDFRIDQHSEEGLVRLTGGGRVNEQAFDIAGEFPRHGRFVTTARFGSVSLSLEGVGIPVEDGGGFTSAVLLDVPDLGDLLDVLRLERAFEGSAAIGFELHDQRGVASVRDLQARFDLKDGELISLSGKVDNVETLSGLDMNLDVRLHPAGAPPIPARRLTEIELAEIRARILGNERTLELEDLRFITNAFEQSLREVGPVTIGRIWRTPERLIAVEDINVQAGPEDVPVLVGVGEIRNGLALKDFDFVGRINAPASLALTSLDAEDVAAFGGIRANFEIGDRNGNFEVRSLTAEAVNTDLWSLDAKMTFGDVVNLDQLETDVSLGVADGASFFSALKLNPVRTGPLSVDASIRGKATDWSGEVRFGVGRSDIGIDFQERPSGRRQRVDASLFSESLRIADLRNAIAGAVELSRLNDLPTETAATSAIPLQPLVLPKDADRSELQPLVLATDDAPAEVVDDGRPELQPLVLPSEPSEIFSIDRILRRSDIYADISFKRISGIEGVTRIASRFVSEGGKARLGPLRFNYGKGSFNFNASMDVINRPEIVSVSGDAAGWDVSDILEMSGVDVQASGALRGRFNLTGSTASVAAFADSMSGSVSLDMRNGQVATSLLELAGLGVFPWLFSQEFRRGYTYIACFVAPLRIRAGKITFDPVVAETRSVQLVARGSVDLNNDTIALRAEPRPIGRPLARSAWPFDVTGALSNPDFKLRVGGVRARRADGATQMPANREPCRPDIFQLQ